MQVTMDDFLDPPAEASAKAVKSKAAKSSAHAPEPATRQPDPMIGRLMQYIDEGTESARSLCERLISDKLASDQRFITGKPAIYPDICSRLDEQVLAGNLELIDKLPGAEDRTYRKTQVKMENELSQKR